MDTFPPVPGTILKAARLEIQVARISKAIPDIGKELRRSQDKFAYIMRELVKLEEKLVAIEDFVSV